MSSFRDLLPTIFEESLEDLPILEENASTPSKDTNGSCTNVLADTLRFIGMAEFLVNEDKKAFRRFLKRSAQLQMDLFNRFEKCEPISKSYVSMLSYGALFNALASGDIHLSGNLASLMGGRKSIEGEYDHPFDLALGYALKSVTLGDPGTSNKLKAFEAFVGLPEDEDFRGFAEVLRAIHENDDHLLKIGFEGVITGHRKQSKEGGIFHGSDGLLCVWGIGLGNLAVSRGMSFEVEDPVLPKELICGLSA